MRSVAAAMAVLLSVVSLQSTFAQKLNTNDGTRLSAYEKPEGTWVPDYNLRNGAVYVMTNQRSNGVVAFARERHSGWLRPAGHFLTGGSGDPLPTRTDPAQNPLASQGALALNQDHTFLYAVNAGSSDITVFKIAPRSLTPVQTISSNGTRPVSITVFDDLVYVLNDGAVPVIAGFKAAEDGTLTPIENSVKQLSGGPSADPVQISFNQDGTLLIVSDKAASVLNSFVVDVNGVPTKALKNPSNGSVPVGFAFTSSGHIVVAETSQQKSAASSYAAGERGTLSMISGSVESSENKSCCVAVTNNALHAFVLNSTSASISAFRLGDDGSLNARPSIAASTGEQSYPIEMALTFNSSFLYVLDAGRRTIIAYKITREGDLKEIGTFGNLPEGAQGIAAR